MKQRPKLNVAVILLGIIGVLVVFYLLPKLIFLGVGQLSTAEITRITQETCGQSRQVSVIYCKRVEYGYVVNDERYTGSEVLPEDGFVLSVGDTLDITYNTLLPAMVQIGKVTFLPSDAVLLILLPAVAGFFWWRRRAKSPVLEAA